MNETMREKLLKVALVAFGAIFFLIYPLGLIWPSGWVWHGGQGEYYLQMMCGVYAVLGAYLILAARNPSEHRTLISRSGRHLIGTYPAYDSSSTNHNCWPIGRMFQS